ncbi:MAG: PHB depolymerase family esterase [Acidobacteriota bacterium]
MPSSRVRSLASTILALVALCCGGAVEAGTFDQRVHAGRSYWLYVPDGIPSGTAAPLVVMLHGCTQTGDGFATSTGMNVIADQEGLLVAYPQQPSSANSSRCWNWFEPAHQGRGSGEPASIAGVVGAIEAAYAVDSDRVAVAGFSAGAAMAVILGATYPDVFVAIGVHSGLEYKAATSASSAFSAMFSGGPPAGPQGDAAYAAMGSRARVVPTMVIHGTSDFTVVTANGDLVLSQWAQTNDRASDGSDNNDIDDTAETVESGQVSGGRSFTRSLYEDGAGSVVMEKVMVDSMGHAWSGGVLGGTYTDPDGPNASQMLADFFFGGTSPPPPPVDTTPPTTTASPAGGTYGVAIDVTLSVDETATTYFTIDGSTPTTGSTIYGGPLAISADATLRFFSVDTAGNVEGVKTESYVIDEGGEPPPPPPSNSTTLASLDGEDGYVGQLWADGSSATLHRVGDKGMFNTDTYRLVLSFDTSAIPTSATVTAATLTITRASATGSVSGLTADVADTFGTAALARSDYSAAASQTAAFTVAVPPSDGSSIATVLPAAVLGVIPGARFQVRLRATTPIDFTSDVLTIHGGGAGGLAPTLDVTWE